MQEGPERGIGVWRDAALILLRPHFQAGQGHLNVQSPENLWTRRGVEGGEDRKMGGGEGGWGGESEDRTGHTAGAPPWGASLLSSLASSPSLPHHNTPPHLPAPPPPASGLASLCGSHPHQGCLSTNANLVHIVGHLQETLFGVVQVPVLGQKLERQT